MKFSPTISLYISFLMELPNLVPSIYMSST